MNKTVLIIGAIIIVLIGVFFIIDIANDYDVTIESEVTELETELAEVETEINNGTLTPEMAAVAQVEISDQLQDISASYEASSEAELTVSQKRQLSDGLERLKRILINYQSTLLTIDESVATLPESERPVLNRDGQSSRSLATIVVDTVSDIQETAADIIDDYIVTPIEDLLADIASSTESMNENEVNEGEEEDAPGDNAEAEATTTSSGEADESSTEVELDIDIEGSVATSS